MGTFDLPPAFIPIGLSGVLGVLATALFAKWGKYR